MIDAIIATIRASDDKPSARTALMAAPFEFTEVQAEHILDMTLSRLTRLGRAQLEEELAKLRQTIAELEAILGRRERTSRRHQVGDGEIRDEFATPVGPRSPSTPGDMDAEDLITDEELVITMTKAGYVKAVPASQFRTQGRGGRGVQGAKLRGRGPGNPDNPHQRPCLFVVLLQPGQGVPAQGLRGASQGAHGPGHSHRQSVAPGTGRAHPGPDRHPGVPVGPVFAVRHQSRGRSRRLHSPSTTSPAGRGSSPSTCGDGDELVGVITTSGDDDIFMVSAARHGHPLRRDRRAAHGPGRRRRPGNEAEAPATRWCRSILPATRRAS